MSLAAKASMAARVAQLSGVTLAERLTPIRPAAPGTVPRSIAALNEDWLTAALCGTTPGARVVDFEAADRTAGTSARTALRVRYNDAGSEAGLPTRLFTKCTPDLKTKLFTGLTNLFIGESRYYTTIRPLLDIESPLGYHASYDLRTCRSMIIMENIAETRGARFIDPTTTRLDRSKAEGMVRLMASYHGAFWADPRLDGEFSWLTTSPAWQRHLDSMINTAAMVRRGLDRAASALPTTLAARQAEIWPAFVRSLELKDRPPLTLLHHDVHSLNWYITRDGGMGLYDWQTMVKGIWAIDVSYALNAGLHVEDRRAWLPDLLELYRERLAAAGAQAPGPDAALLAYRQQTIHGLIFWLATIGASSLQPALHRRDVCLTHIGRLAQAAEDLDTLDALAR